MLNRIKELYFEIGLVKSILWLTALIIGVVGLTASLIFAILFLMQEFDDRYRESEEGKIEMKIDQINSSNYEEQKENNDG